MITVTYTTYSKILNKTFTNTKQVNTISDFRLFAMSLNLDYTIIKQQTA